MAQFLSGLVGGGADSGIAKVVGEKAGEFVEDTVKKVLSGQGKKDQEGAEGNDKGGLDVGNMLNFGGKDEGKGGLDLGDGLSLLGGSKDKNKGDGGLDLTGAIGNFMK